MKKICKYCGNEVKSKELTDVCSVCKHKLKYVKELVKVCQEIKKECGRGQKPKQKQRQIDRIRNMSVEELARFLHKTAEKTETCEDCPINDFCEERITRLGCSVAMFIEWLESEVTE